MQKILYVYILDTMADWELSHAIGELHSGRYFKKDAERFVIKTVAATKNPIQTMGGFMVMPDLTVEEMDSEHSAGLLLPGADTWADASHDQIIHKAKLFLEEGLLVGAMCGATGALAQAGIFDSREHTSNDKAFLRMVAPEYKGERYYRQERAVRDKNLITGSAAGSLLFARYVLDYFEVLSPESLEAWYDYFETNDAKHFFALLNSLPRN